MTIIADLHIHTKASDGLLSPQEVVILAAEKGLCTIAITDHDTVAGIDEAKAEGQKLGIHVIPGIEFSTVYKGKEVHILGYGFDYKDKAIKGFFDKLTISRFSRMETMVTKLQQLHFDITMDEVLRQAGDAAPSRPHAARVLVAKGYFITVSEVFEELLDVGKAAYVERYKLTPRDAISVISQTGGFTSWAHPGLVGEDHFLSEFTAWGLKGIEVYHPDHNRDMETHYLELARKYNLMATGGSDYHGQETGRIRNLASYGLTPEDYTSIEYMFCS